MQGQVRVMSRLAERIVADTLVNVAYRNTSGAREKMLYALRCYTRDPSAAEKLMFERLGVDPHLTLESLTQSKMNGVYALLCRVLTPPGRKAWGVKATPDPEAPESVDAEAWFRIFQEEIFKAQEGGGGSVPEALAEAALARRDEVMEARVAWAEERAKRMDAKLDDILTEGGLLDALQDFAHNICVYGTGVIVGPCETAYRGLRFRQGKREGVVAYEVADRKGMSFHAPNPYDVYPSPGVKRADHGSLVMKAVYSPAELSYFAGQAGRKPSGGGRLNGWDVGAVRRVVRQYPSGGCSVNFILNDELKRVLEDSPTYLSAMGAIEGLRWFGSVPGEWLEESGVKSGYGGERLDPYRYYECEAVYIAGEVVYAAVADPVIGRPVFKTSFYGDGNMFFGNGLADALAPVQSLATVCAAGLKKQVQMTSGPVTVFNDVDNFLNNSGQPGFFSLAPNKVFTRKSADLMMSASAANMPPIQMFNVPHTIAETLRVVTEIDRLADDRSGFSRSAFGSGSFTGATRTAAGLQMVQEAANILGDFVLFNIEQKVVMPLIRKVVMWQNLRGDDDTVRGDVQVVPLGALGEAMRSTRVGQAREVFQTVVALRDVIEPEGLFAALRDYLEAVGSKRVGEIVGSKGHIEFLQAMRRIRQMQEALAAGGGEEAQGTRAAGGNIAVGTTSYPPTIAPPASPEPRPGTVRERRAAA